jgi:hypothetical protein
MVPLKATQAFSPNRGIFQIIHATLQVGNAEAADARLCFQCGTTTELTPTKRLNTLICCAWIPSDERQSVVGFSQESFDLLHVSSVHDNPSDHVCCVPN